MAASSSRPAYHQDYIARIRYSNALPPPPNPPKLLDIPNTGLSSGQYTAAGYASRLAREQPLNIEADAELGMPIDLVGLPGVFEGDESVIQAQDDAPAVHPKDRQLLRPLASLGKTAAMESVSFLRRTEYITAVAGNGQRYESSLARAARMARKKHQPDDKKTDPISIMRGILKGFDIAYPHDAYKGPEGPEALRGEEHTPAEMDAWLNPTHPTKPGVTLLDSYPVLPDLEALPDTGGYLVVKFDKNPVPDIGRYDDRLDVAILHPEEPTEAEREAAMLVAEQRQQDPSIAPYQMRYNYKFFLPSSADAVRGIKRKFDVDDPDRDDPALYDAVNADGVRHFRYDRVRNYETSQQTGDAEAPYSDTVALALHDDDEGGGAPKAAYYYPVQARSTIRARRPATRMGVLSGQAAYEEEEQGRIDALEVQFQDPSEQEAAKRAAQRAKFDA